jgi:outer membrane receptor protein involved in Fe transport
LQVQRSGAAFVIVRTGPQALAAPIEGQEAITVTGSRIRGAPIASPVIQVTREQARNAGQATLVELARSIPQNFGGGQNPGVGFNVPETNGADVGGGASFNLRGLGGDATLTLLNGHRLSYNAAKQSVDISGIPLGAVSRVDVVPDGASALFGSDAVAGVVNILLRRDLDGVETSARFGTATDGGGFSQTYGATAGTVWRSGNFLVAYEYGSNDAILARQRDYAATRSPGLTLFPAQRRHSVLASLEQDLAPDLRFAMDGLFNKRWTDLTYPLAAGGDLSLARGKTQSTARAWGLSPSLSWKLADGWSTMLSASYGEDRVDYGGYSFQGGVLSVNTGGYYINRARSIELSADGRLFALPGGPAKIALGAGHRQIDFRRFTGINGTQNIDRSQADTYGFGELSLPMVSPDQAVPWAHSLVLSAAVRYEVYRGIGDVATPKLGLIYAPHRDITLKASWGRSFRAPTLYQQYQPQTLYLTRTTTVGGQGYPASATALLLLGGNPDLAPERSTNWSATLELRPRFADGVSLELGYFSVHYRDRIVTPIPSLSTALRDAGYASFVTMNPPGAEQAATIAGASVFTNLTGGAAYNPANVVALVRNTSVNAGRQSVHGIDALLHYSGDLGGGTLSASANATWLESEQQIGPALPVTQLAGVIFNPPHLRLRADLGWSIGAVTLTANVTRIGPVVDNRSAPSARIPGMTPVDLTLRYRPDSGPLRGFDLIASVQNLFNATPSPIATTLFYDTPYDSTNYSPLGRFLSLSVTRKW